MLIQDVVGNVMASSIPKDIENMMLKLKIIKVRSAHEVYSLRSDHFIANLIFWRRKLRNEDLSVHPLAMLGFLTTDELIKQVFNNKVVIQALRKFDRSKPKGPENPHGYTKDDDIAAYYTPPSKNIFGKRPNPAKGEIGISVTQVAEKEWTELHLAHEFMHRGLAMASWNKGISRNIPSMMLQDPYDAWGVNKKNWPQMVKSMKRFGSQLAALEHIMIYAYEGSKDPIYSNNPQLYKSVPGFENSRSWESAKAKGLKLLDAIGDGATAYIILTAQRINNVPDEDLDELIFKFAKLLGKI